MQFIETHVSNSADGMVTVEFKGESNELVSVTMVGGDGSLDGDHAVLRAKEMMVQLTAFDEAPAASMGQRAGGLTSGDIHSEAEPIPSAAPGSRIRAD